MDLLLSPKKLIKMTKLQKKVPVTNRLHISTTGKGTFVIYTLDERRFVLPLSYLANNIIQELFKMSEEEFGISSCDPIIFPCDSRLMNYILSLVKLGMSVDLKKGLRDTIIQNRFFISDIDRQGDSRETSKQLLLCGY